MDQLRIGRLGEYKLRLSTRHLMTAHRDWSCVTTASKPHSLERRHLFCKQREKPFGDFYDQSCVTVTAATEAKMNFGLVWIGGQAKFLTSAKFLIYSCWLSVILLLRV